MNFLAHMLLSRESDPLLVGNFLGDLLRNPEIKLLPPDIRAGVRLHRLIDSYTDLHPLIRQGTHRLHAQHGKYASVLIDVYYDYLLSLHWPTFSDLPIRTFTHDVYRRLLRFREHMPERTQRQLQAMVQDDWLMNYATFEGLEVTFLRLQSRVSKPEQLIGAVNSLQTGLALFEAEFLQFFPQIKVYLEEQEVY